MDWGSAKCTDPVYNKTTEQQPTSLKMKLTSMPARMDYVVIDFLGGCLSAKVKLLQLRETSVISSCIH